MHCIGRICNIRWQDRVLNTTVLEICKATGIESTLDNSQLRWAGHLVRMKDTRVSKTLFYGQLEGGIATAYAPMSTLQRYLKGCDMSLATWEADSQEKRLRRTRCYLAVNEYEKDHITKQKQE